MNQLSGTEIKTGRKFSNNSDRRHINSQLELPRPIPRNSVELGHGCKSRICFDNAGDNVTTTLYNVTLTSHIPC